MKRESLKLLSKDELIEIIISDKRLECRAFNKLIDVVSKKVLSIIDKQAECDLTTSSGRKEYLRLEKEYEKWSKIHENL